jgi:hypothetical protein
MQYVQFPLPPAQSETAEQIRNQINEDWDNGMLNNAS